MPESAAAFPYVTNLNVLFGPLEPIDVQTLVDACTDQWYNQTLCRVNDSVVRLGIVQGEYHWHKHDQEDEFFYVVEGRFLIELEGRTIDLGPRFRGAEGGAASPACSGAHHDTDGRRCRDRPHG
jgi:hypothetical protein